MIKSPENPAQRRRLFSLDSLSFFGYAGWLDQLVGAVNMLSVDSAPQTAVFEEQLVIACRFLLLAIKDFLRSVTLMWRINLSVGSGVDCAFVSGALFALQRSFSRVFSQRVVQHNVPNVFTMLLVRSSSRVEELSRMVLPVIINFGTMTSYASDTKRLCLPDTFLMADRAAYNFVGENFDYKTRQTKVRKFVEQESFLQNLLDAINDGMARQDSFLRAKTFVVQWLMRIQPNYMLYTLEDMAYVPCYLAGALAENTASQNYVVSILRSRPPFIGFGLEILDKQTSKRTILNFIVRDWAGSIVNIDLNRILGHMIFSNNPIGLGGDHMVFNIYYGPQNSMFPNPAGPHLNVMDYIQYGVFMSTVQSETVAAMFTSRIVPALNLKHELQLFLNGEKPLETCMTALTAFLVELQAIVRTDAALGAVFDGLVSRQRSVRNGLLFRPGALLVAHQTIVVHERDQLGGPAKQTFVAIVLNDQHAGPSDLLTSGQPENLKILRLAFQSGHSSGQITLEGRASFFHRSAPTSSTVMSRCEL